MKKYYSHNEQKGISRTLSRDILKKGIFADSPHNWLIHSRGFYHASCQIIGVLNANEAQFPKIITDEMFFHHRYSYKIAVYLVSHAIELVLKASISYYNLNNSSNPLNRPASYGHNAKNMFNALRQVDYLDKNDMDNEIIEMVNTYLKWFGRYYSPNEKHVDKTLNEDYVQHENDLLDFKHQLDGAHKKLSIFYQRTVSKIKLGNLFFHYSCQMP